MLKKSVQTYYEKNIKQKAYEALVSYLNSRRNKDAVHLQARVVNRKRTLAVFLKIWRQRYLF